MLRVFSFLLPVLFICACSSRKENTGAVPKMGVNRSLAIYRKTVLSNIRYTLKLDIPAQQTEAIAAEEEINFELSVLSQPLQLDFSADPANIISLTINGKKTAPKLQQEHLILPYELLQQGLNSVKVDFKAGDGALNRNADYLYTLFVPDRARSVFPCFDQPDLKAIYTLTLVLPNNGKP